MRFKLVSNFLTVFFFTQAAFASAPIVEDYGKNILLDHQEADLRPIHQFLVGSVVNSAYENVTSAQYTFLYPFKYIHLGFEVMYNDIVAKDFLKEIAEDSDIESVIPKNQYGAIISWTFAQNIMNLLNWKFFRFDLSFDLSAGQSIDNANEKSRFTSYGLRIKTQEVWDNTHLIFKFQGNNIYSSEEDINYNQYLLGFAYHF